MLSDLEAVKNLTCMLTRCMGEEKPTVAISAPLPRRDVCQVRKQKRTGRELKINVELRSYDMDDVMLDLGSDVNILPKKYWELLGKPNLVWSPIQLRLANQY
jgi:hypothetical protein